MNKLPAPIRIGGFDYAVIEWPEREAKAVGRSGECDTVELIIKVRTDLPPTRKAEVLIHEILHGACDAGFLLGGEDEEKIVSVLGNQLAAIWYANPLLVAWLEAVYRPDPVRKGKA